MTTPEAELIVMWHLGLCQCTAYRILVIGVVRSEAECV